MICCSNPVFNPELQIFLYALPVPGPPFGAGPGLAGIKEIKRLCGGDLQVAAQANVQIDAEIGQKDHLRFEMETGSYSAGNDFLVEPRFQSGNEDFWPISRKSSVCAEATCRSPHKQTCRLTPRLAKKTISGSSWKPVRIQPEMISWQSPVSNPEMRIFGQYQGNQAFVRRRPAGRRTSKRAD